MTERERLIELIDKGEKLAVSLSVKQTAEFIKEHHHYNSATDNTVSISEIVADYLLANGVIVPPVKIGTKVYLTPASGTEIYEHTIDGYRSITNGLAPVEMLIDVCWGNTDHIGKTVFLTREEAEKALTSK